MTSDERERQRTVGRFEVLHMRICVSFR